MNAKRSAGPSTSQSSGAQNNSANGTYQYTYEDYLAAGYTPAQLQQWYNSYYGQTGYPAAAATQVQPASANSSPSSSKISITQKPAAGGKQRVELTKSHRQSNLPTTTTSGAIRSAGGEVWQDPTLAEWDTDDYRLFVGNLGREVTDADLRQAFQSKYPSFQKARVVRDQKSHKSKGYGFVSFKEGEDFLKAFREMQGKYIGSRPVKLQKSNWKDRNVTATFAKKVAKQGYLGIVKQEIEHAHKTT